jgi:hypothetical protein
MLQYDPQSPHLTKLYLGSTVFPGSLKHVPVLEANMPAALFSKQRGLRRSVNEVEKVRDMYTMFGGEAVPNAGAGAGPFKLRVVFFNAIHPEVEGGMGLTWGCTQMLISIYIDE